MFSSSNRDTEHNKMSAGQLCGLALFCALMTVGKELMNFIPNVHPVTLFIILGVMLYGRVFVFPVAGFVLIEIALYGMGWWTWSYLYIWPLQLLTALPLRNSRSGLLWACFAGLHGLFFGALSSLSTLLVSGWRAAVAYWAAGIPFDLAHAAGNFLLVYFLLMPLYDRITRAGAESIKS